MSYKCSFQFFFFVQEKSKLHQEKVSACFFLGQLLQAYLIFFQRLYEKCLSLSGPRSQTTSTQRGGMEGTRRACFQKERVEIFAHKSTVTKKSTTNFQCRLLPLICRNVKAGSYLAISLMENKMLTLHIHQGAILFKFYFKPKNKLSPQ